MSFTAIFLLQIRSLRCGAWPPGVFFFAAERRRSAFPPKRTNCRKFWSELGPNARTQIPNPEMPAGSASRRAVSTATKLNCTVEVRIAEVRLITLAVNGRLTNRTTAGNLIPL